jgi:hypothetical protein
MYSTMAWRIHTNHPVAYTRERKSFFAHHQISLPLSMQSIPTIINHTSTQTPDIPSPHSLLTPIRPPARLPQLPPLIKQIRPRTPQINNLRTPIPILLQPRAIRTIIRITNPDAAADNALARVIAKGAFVADAHLRCWAHVAVADGAAAVVALAEAADADSCLAAAHDEIGVVAGHFGLWMGD